MESKSRRQIFFTCKLYRLKFNISLQKNSLKYIYSWKQRDIFIISLPELALEPSKVNTIYLFEA